MIKLRTLAKKVTDAIYPDNTYCIMCGREKPTAEYEICEECLLQLKDAKEVRSIIDCTALDDMTAAFRYKDLLSDVIKRMKYSNANYLCKRLAVFFEAGEDWDFDFVTCVPMHRLSKIKRGYNQAELLAKEYAKAHNLTFRGDVLKRIIRPKRQANLTRAERLKAQQNTMTADESKAAGRSILVIDDVCTTGSTLNECARALKEAGAVRVYAMVLAHG